MADIDYLLKKQSFIELDARHVPKAYSMQHLKKNCSILLHVSCRRG